MAWFIKEGSNVFKNNGTIFRIGQNSEGINEEFYTLSNTGNYLYESGNIVDCDDSKLFYVNAFSGATAGVNIANLTNLTNITTVLFPSCVCVRADKNNSRIFLSNVSNVKIIDYNNYSDIGTLPLSNIFTIDYDIGNNIIIFGNLIYNYDTLTPITSIPLNLVKSVKLDQNSQIFIANGNGNSYTFWVYDYNYSAVGSISYSQTGGANRYRGMIIKDGYLGLQCSNGIRFMPLNNIFSGYNSVMNINVGNTYIHGMCYDQVYNRIFHSYLITSPNVSHIYKYLFK